VVGVQTAAVRRGPLQRTLRVTGFVDDDDTRHRILSARVPGRIEKLHVNFVGAEVEEGAPLATIFSPEMLTAQREFVERVKAGSAVFTLAERSKARERLLELGLTDEEVDILERTLKPSPMVNVRAPMSGTVVARAVYEGKYVEADDELFQIGDFSRMWFVFDAYEPDLAWLRPGQPVEVTVPSLPGKILTAPIAFIDPNLSEATRTAKVRVILDNPERLLRHRQTATATVSIDSPEALLVPRSAVLQHGGKAVVFVDRTAHAYAAREIRLGRVGDRDAEVLGGLNEGDKVVTEGALILDGQAQLAHAAVGGDGHDHAAAAPTKISVEVPKHDASAYALLKTLAFAAADSADALASDDLAAYRRHLPALRAALDAYVAGFAPAARGPLASASAKLADAAEIEAVRRAFEPFSTDLADLARAEHLHHREQLWIYQCPMSPVLGTGRWLSKAKQLRNPFFGSAMLECGEEID
jgi:Cu(I)/Ag(I) efflux system membrane fusion protein